MSGGHSLLAPSSASIWSNCPGYVLAKQALNLPESNTEHTSEGTRAHEMAVQFKRKGIPEKLSGEMEEAVAQYVRYMQLIEQVTGSLFCLEAKLDCSPIHERCFGTCDGYLLESKNGEYTLYIIDFKYGHSLVEVFENRQLLCYAAGLLNHLKLLSCNVKIAFIIVQPRGFHADGPIRTWETTSVEIAQRITEMSIAAHKALNGTGDTISGPHCKYCELRYTCKSAIEAGLSMYEAVFAMSLPETNNDPQTLGVFYKVLCRAKAQIEYLHTGVETQLKSLITSGVNVPGVRCIPAPGRLNWNRPISDIVAMGDLCGVDLRKNDIVTPTQAISKGLPESALFGCTARENKGVKLEIDDTTKAQLIFSKGA